MPYPGGGGFFKCLSGCSSCASFLAACFAWNLAWILIVNFRVDFNSRCSLMRQYYEINSLRNFEPSKSPEKKDSFKELRMKIVILAKKQD